MEHLKTALLEEPYGKVPEDQEFLDPILVTGCARSGTSVTASIIRVCGAWTGPTVPPAMEMPTGFEENLFIRQAIIKPLMACLGADTLGQASLLNPRAVDQYVDERMIKYLRKSFSNAVFAQGLRTKDENKNEAWLIKDARFMSIYPIMERVFPEARWVVVQRDKEEIIASCERTKFMSYRGDVNWSKWVDLNKENEAALLEGHKCDLTLTSYSDIVSLHFDELENFVEKEEALEWDAYEVEDLIV